MSEDNELDRLIIRNIADLEASIVRAKELGENLATEVTDLIKQFADERGWFFLPSDDGCINARFGPRDWQVRDGKPDFWFCLGETSASDEYDETWIAEFLGVGPNAASVELLFDQSLVSEAQMRKMLSSDPAALLLLDEQDFRHEHGYIRTPVVLELEAIVKAFGEGDFSAALLPLIQRMEAAAEGIGSFDAVALRVRERAI